MKVEAFYLVFYTTSQEQIEMKGQDPYRISTDIMWGEGLVTTNQGWKFWLRSHCSPIPPGVRTPLYSWESLEIKALCLFFDDRGRDGAVVLSVGFVGTEQLLSFCFARLPFIVCFTSLERADCTWIFFVSSCCYFWVGGSFITQFKIHPGSHHRVILWVSHSAAFFPSSGVILCFP